MTEQNVVEEALAKGKFSVLDAAKGRSYPQDIVDVYTDAETAYEAKKIERSINAEKQGLRAAELEEEKAVFANKVKESVLTFHMRGVAPNVAKGNESAADEKFGADESPAKRLWLNQAHLAANIISVTNADNETDEHLFTQEEVEELDGWLPPSEMAKLWDMMFELTFARDVFDQAVGPDFSQRR